MVCQRASERALCGVSALLFTGGAAVTIVWCVSISAMGEMLMPGRTEKRGRHPSRDAGLPCWLW
jgi:hypothetical protein